MMLGAIGVWVLGIPWKEIAVAALKHWREVLIAILMVFVWYRGNKIEDLRVELNEEQQKIQGYNNAILTLEEVIEHNAVAMIECMNVNESNAAEARKHEEAMHEAVKRLKQFESTVARYQEDVYREAQGFRGRDTACRSLHSPDFPQWFIDWVRNNPSPDSGD